MTPIYKTAAGERLVRERYGETFVVACVHISQNLRRSPTRRLRSSRTPSDRDDDFPSRMSVLDVADGGRDLT